MIDLKTITTQTDQVLRSLQKRNQLSVHTETVSEIVAFDKLRREALQAVEALKAKRNQASQEIARLKKEKKDDSSLLEQMKVVAHEIKEKDSKVTALIEKMDELLLGLPNLLHESVPEGKDSVQNVEIRTWGKPPGFSFSPKTHDEIGEKLGVFDFKKAGDVSGARFTFLKGRAVKLERALIQFMMDEHANCGYEEIMPPYLVNRKSLTGTGQLPKFEEDVFRIEKFDYFLVPTAEVPVTNYHRDEILLEKQLPLKYVAFSPCFRSEAGSYGKDTKGLKRQHQFHKVELVKFTTPGSALNELEGLVADAEKILQKLGLHYRVMLLCGGDTGFGSHKTYDIEVWSPAQRAYMEISSCSTFSDFQARRASIRYRDGSGTVHFCHTLNGSGLAVGRTLIAIMENFQTESGDFDIPDVLKKYF